MKKILFAALAALAITSCSQNEIDGIDNGTPKSKNEIGVNTIVKKSSRATVKRWFRRIKICVHLSDAEYMVPQ